jgi:hypothetical protein
MLDGDPGDALVEYVEQVLGFHILWVENSRSFGGARTAARLSALNIASGDEQ